MKIREVLKPELVEQASASEPYYSFGFVKAMFRRLHKCEMEPRSTPECLLKTLEWSLEYKDIYAYGQCLSEEYLFQFTSPDAEIVGLPADEPWWGKTEDYSAMYSMFKDPDLSYIDCAFEIKAGPWATETGLGYRLEPDMRFTVTEGEEEPVIFMVRDSRLDVAIVVDPYDSEKWVFAEIMEVLKGPHAASSLRPSAGASETVTFGRVKAMFK